MKNSILLLLICFTTTAYSQKRALEHEDFDTWKRITGTKISRDGQHILYHLAPGKGDKSLSIRTTSGKEVLQTERAENGTFTWDNRYAVFKIKPAMDSVNALRRVKTKKELMPRDSLGIFDMNEGVLERIPQVRRFDVPEKWTGYIFYQLDTPLPESKEVEEDSTAAENPIPKPKSVSEENGFHLIVYNLREKTSDTVKYVTNYKLARDKPYFIYHTTGKDSTITAGVYHVSLETNTTTPLTRHAKGKFNGLSINGTGDYAAFLTDLDTTKALVRNHQLRLWKSGQDSARVVVEQGNDQIPENWLVSEHGNLIFSDNNSNLFFGTTPEPVVQDTTLLEEEIVKVEIWSYTDSRLHTQQNAELDEDKKKNYLSALNLESGNIQQLASLNMADVALDEKFNSLTALGFDYEPYNKYLSWEGFPRRQDVYKVDIASGDQKRVVKDLRGHAHLSPSGKYIFWYSSSDTTWFVYDNASESVDRISIDESFANERNDQPNYPSDYGFAGWTDNDEAFLLYDRFDIWKYEPENGMTTKLTSGRESRVRYRYIDLDPENEAIDPDFLLLSTFNEKSRDGGYAQMKKLKAVKPLINGPYAYSRPIKALDSDDLIYTRQSQKVFPDILASTLSFKNEVRISNANPEQSNYLWGSVELYSWTSLDGIELEGLLYKPENFDASKKYPMITYFYERNSDNLNRHWGAVPIRSIVNPAFYSSRGYLVFIPDIVYETGYPGRSCYNAVVPGVQSLIEEGFVDAENLGVQGHSWGGYQVSYLVTQTNMFKAAEAGAVVSNMISAYGGIRWWTGLSRMFQYEHTQSRIGGTLWEYPDLYIENSPIFMADKIETPLLLMHNDEDGHVPWYQGIEFFVGLRRLNKPVWMLNYNGEPHWPTKYENIRDFNIRMQQFFDHYLKSAPLPKWMSEDGVPAMEKGIDNGIELLGDDRR